MKKLINTETLCWNRCFYTRFSFSDGSFEWYHRADANINSYPENDSCSQALEEEYQKMINKPVETNIGKNKKNSEKSQS
jgi:hypothetical protein